LKNKNENIETSNSPSLFFIIIALIIGIWINPGNSIQIFPGYSVRKNVTPGIHTSQTLLQKNSFLG
jgi:hypothetical protein